MDTLPSMDSLWLFGTILLAGTGVYFITAWVFTLSIIPGVTLRDRKHSTAQTPPRSISPDRKPTSSNTSNHAITLPPSRRHTLIDLEHEKVPWRDVTDDEVRMNLLPMSANYKTSPSNKYTPMGFSVKEINDLGNFPDYAALSGVPLPSPYPEFDIAKALPRPYRPFRWSYHQTMSLTKLETDWWIELENTYTSRIAQRKELFAKHGTNVLNAMPGSELACKELMEMVLQFICARYPQYFTLVDGHILQNRILGTEQDVTAKPPLEVLLDNVPEDFGIMLRDETTGFYFLRAAVICSSLGWNVASKVGKQLHEIHETIPDYKEKMQFSMDRFFTKMPTEKPIQRGSWGLEIEQPLYMPPGDPHELARLSQREDLTIDECHLRVDWQTLRRLPLSGAVVFNFKALFTPIREFRDEPGVPELLMKVLTEGKKSIMDYKGVWHVQHVVLPNLRAWAEEQKENGLVQKDWEVATLDDSPWFKGWQEKWHRQQGF
ncbi:unnamed protein product [Penicillium salamii]|uniref:Uncharacterized protein n=1 Tax=Penicillium salamii TaxID=1612424 RepID=A0A9W4ID58_9EURO|nr:unnamed protein product [Penicillium salamii]CAG7960745.1 unnamed protein product [Penicillium salamii]CAG7964409.1 unnamed protein product [Penicillium salamii]CAG7982208.1 unnamed protein product [Penicillium salamii]CAG8126308.1 unnamed protein product [Penicillium salamii]